jgi:nitroreductase
MKILAPLSKSFLFVSEFSQDAILYMKHCGISPRRDKRKAAYYKIIIEIHAIEKGLSLAQMRPLFGQQKIRAVMQMARTYGLASSDLPIRMTIGALATYVGTHRTLGHDDPFLDEVDAFIAEQCAVSSELGDGGLRQYPAGVPIPDSPAELLLSRFSCRIYDTEPLSHALVWQIVQTAQCAPSQCNRQATQVYYFDDRTKVRALLKLQGGSAGFQDEVPGLFVITFDLAAWGGAQQRNQGYVDGGLFSMTMMLAAHALGLVTCPLNLAVSHKTERRIKALAEIPDDQRLVMMMAIGKAPDGAVRAAASPRRPVDEVLTLRSSTEAVS